MLKRSQFRQRSNSMCNIVRYKRSLQEKEAEAARKSRGASKARNKPSWNPPAPVHARKPAALPHNNPPAPIHARNLAALPHNNPPAPIHAHNPTVPPHGPPRAHSFTQSNSLASWNPPAQCNSLATLQGKVCAGRKQNQPSPLRCSRHRQSCCGRHQRHIQQSVSPEQ